MKGLPLALLLAAAFNTAIALLLALVGFGGGLRENFVFSQCIGFSVLLIVHAGWRLLWADRRPPTAPMIALVIFAIVGGWLGGSALATAILGLPWNPGRSGGAALAITAAAGLIGTYFFWTRERTSRIERHTIEAKLKLLQAQIEPHFLFNTLANLDALIQTDPMRARAMLGHLNGYLRATLAASRKERGTLEEEFALLRGYLDVQAIRMGARLKHSLALPPALARASVPPMLLQPLVENAIKHGLEPKMEGGEIMVQAAADGGRLVLTVSDTGLGLAASRAGGTGVGLANLRERLAAAYGPAASVEIAAVPEGGTAVTLRLPFA
jgi:signal transduction histidine kinase